MPSKYIGEPLLIFPDNIGAEGMVKPICWIISGVKLNCFCEMRTVLYYSLAILDQPDQNTNNPWLFGKMLSWLVAQRPAADLPES